MAKARAEAAPYQADEASGRVPAAATLAAWSRVCDAVLGLDASEYESGDDLLNPDWREDVVAVAAAGLADLLVDWVTDQAHQQLVHVHVPAFWKTLQPFRGMCGTEATPTLRRSSVRWLSQAVPAAVAALHAALTLYIDVLHAVLRAASRPEHVIASHLAQLRTRALAAVLTTDPGDLHHVLLAYFAMSFRFFYREQVVRARARQASPIGGAREEPFARLASASPVPPAELDDDVTTPGGLSLSSSPLPISPSAAAMSPPASPLSFHRVCQLLLSLRLLPVLERVLGDFVFKHVQERVHAQCSGKFEGPLLVRVLRWLHHVVLPWLQLVLSAGDDVTSSSDAPGALFMQWQVRLDVFVHETLAALRMSELFDIIVDYPDSALAVLDLKTCVEVTHQTPALVKSLNSAFQRRLLHPGADTHDIITQFIGTINVLKVLDPSGRVVDAVSAPISAYLRRRPETIRCIVRALVDTNSELFDELTNGAAAHNSAASASAAATEVADAAWTPEPLRADAADAAADGIDNDDDGLGLGSSGDSSNGGGGNDSDGRGVGDGVGQDTIGRLVGVFGNAAMFVEEYRHLVAERLLRVTDYDTSKEVRALELLRLRFGDASLRPCEAMLKDMADSKRTDAHIHSKLGGSADDAKLHATIISKQAWPKLPRGDAIGRFPAPMKQLAEAYQREYSVLKTPRAIRWLPSLGTVELTLQVDDRPPRPYRVSPLLAAVLACFTDTQQTWTLQQIADELQAPAALISSRIPYWLHCGVLQLTGTDTYQLVGSGSGRDTSEASYAAAQAAAMPETDRLKDAMAGFKQLIFHMLTARGAQSVGAIHNALKMFSFDPKYDRSEADLSRFLQLLVNDDELECNGGLYLRKAQQ